MREFIVRKVKPIKNKLYFYKNFPLTKDSFPLTEFFYATKYWKMWKIIFIEGFPTKQTECKKKIIILIKDSLNFDQQIS